MNSSAEYFMEQAFLEAERAAELGECPIGAVVVKNGEIIGRGHNLVEKLHDASQHAEIIAMREASEKLNNWRLSDTTLYVTLEPCPMCIGAILLARVDTLFFSAHDQRLGAVGSLFDISAHPALPHRIEVVSGLFAQRSQQLLSDFFQQRRKIQTSGRRKTVSD